MSVFQQILPYVAVVNAKLNYVETTYDSYIFELKNLKLPATIKDKNMKMVLKERTPIIQLDINQQNIGMYDYSVENFGGGVRFTLPKNKFPYVIDANDIVQVTGTFQR